MVENDAAWMGLPRLPEGGETYAVGGLMESKQRRRFRTCLEIIEKSVDSIRHQLNHEPDLDVIRERFVEIYNEAKEGMYTIDMIWSDQQVEGKEGDEFSIPDTRVRPDLDTEGRLQRAYIVTCWYGGHDHLCLPGTRASAEAELEALGWGKVDGGRWVCPEVMKSGNEKKE